MVISWEWKREREREQQVEYEFNIYIHLEILSCTVGNLEIQFVCPIKSLKYSQTEHEHSQIYLSYKVHKHISFCVYVRYISVFQYLCKRNSNLIYAPHRRNETKRFHISLTFSFVSYEEAAAAAMAGHGSRRACVLLCCILITK